MGSIMETGILKCTHKEHIMCYARYAIEESPSPWQAIGFGVVASS